MGREDWFWMPHAAHFVESELCQFRLSTHVGDFIVSSLGDKMKRSSFAPQEKPEYEKMNLDTDYECMVFVAAKMETNECGCPVRPNIRIGVIEESRPETVVGAVEEHYRLCDKYSDAIYLNSEVVFDV